MKLVVFCCNLILFTLTNYSQKILNSESQLILANTPSNNDAIGNINAEQIKKSETFQLIISNPEMQYAVTDEFLKWIEENRLIDKDQTLQINENISVLILSKDKINATDFKPVTKVIYSGKP